MELIEVDFAKDAVRNVGLEAKDPYTVGSQLTFRMMMLRPGWGSLG